MRLCIVALAGLLCVTASAQDSKGIELGVPQFVAKKVSNVFWAEDGRALAYTTETKQGPAIGVYDLDQGEGKTVLPLAKGDEITTVSWLKVGKKAVFIVQNKKDVANLTVYVLDAHELSAHQVWSRQFPKDTEAAFDVDVSPTLPHALLTLHDSKNTETWVLLAGGSGLVFSRDIAAATAQGQVFAGWTTSGTAVFGQNDGKSGIFKLGGTGPNGTVTLANVLGERIKDFVGTIELSTSKYSADLGSKPADIDGQKATVLSGVPIISTFFLRAMPAIAPGATCLECLPSNGALRSVKFPGYYEEKPGPTQFPDPFAKLESLKLGRTETGSQALWLVNQQPAQAEEQLEGQPPKPAQEPQSGVLVSAQADAWWPSTYTRSVAFTWNGALFVRTVKYTSK